MCSCPNVCNCPKDDSRPGSGGGAPHGLRGSNALMQCMVRAMDVWGAGEALRRACGAAVRVCIDSIIGVPLRQAGPGHLLLALAWLGTRG